MMAHSPEAKSASPAESRPPYLNNPAFCMSMRFWMCLTWSGLLNLSSVSSPAMPLTLVASGTLWMALKFSNCVQVGQAVVSGHSMPAAFSFFAASIVSGHVKGGLVIEHDRRRAVEGHRQHLAIGCRVVALDGGDEGIRVEGQTGFLHQLVDRLYGALCRHHGRGADLEHLDDPRRVAGTERGDGTGHDFGVLALEAGVDAVLFLRGVEVGSDLLEHAAQRLGEPVPELDLHRCGLRHGGAGAG